MLLPRIILLIQNRSDMQVIQERAGLSTVGVYFKTNHLDRATAFTLAQEIKIICLQSQCVLLLDNVEIAALVNGDGVICAIDDDMQGRAKDVLGDDKLVGGTAHTIQDVASLFEEGIADFVMLSSYADVAGADNILGKHKAQSIIDDARIMGYNIPIILLGGIDIDVAEDALATRAYGIVTSDLFNLDHFNSLLLQFPLR